jgi:hypothetical protein
MTTRRKYPMSVEEAKVMSDELLKKKDKSDEDTLVKFLTGEISDIEVKKRFLKTTIEWQEELEERLAGSYVRVRSHYSKESRERADNAMQKMHDRIMEMVEELEVLETLVWR